MQDIFLVIRCASYRIYDKEMPVVSIFSCHQSLQTCMQCIFVCSFFFKKFYHFFRQYWSFLSHWGKCTEGESFTLASREVNKNNFFILLTNVSVCLMCTVTYVFYLFSPFSITKEINTEALFSSFLFVFISVPQLSA